MAVFCRDSQQHHAYTVTQVWSAWNLVVLVPSTSSTATPKLPVLYPCCQSGSQDGASPGPSWEAAWPLGGVLSPVLLPQLWGSQCFPPCDTQVVAMPWQVHVLSRSMSAAGDMEIPRHHQSNWDCCSCSREMVHPFWELQCKLSQSQVITTWLPLPCPSSEDCYVFLPLSPCPRTGLTASAAQTPHQPHRTDLPLSFRPCVSSWGQEQDWSWVKPPQPACQLEAEMVKESLNHFCAVQAQEYNSRRSRSHTSTATAVSLSNFIWTHQQPNPILESTKALVAHDRHAPDFLLCYSDNGF